MLLNRQKILLSYLYLNGKECSRLHITKALFLFCEEIENNIYDFHPYIRGPFSELVFLDLRKLAEKGIIKNGEYNVSIIDKELIKTFLQKLDPNILYSLSNIVNQYGRMSDEDLMNKVYKIYPYYAINNPDRNKDFAKFDPRKKSINTIPIIFTIGYEGITIDKYVDKLIQNNVNILVDIRKNPNSMKYGFSSARLKQIVEKRGIKYLSIKELGIEGEDRKDLASFVDYQKLFENYKKTLPEKEKYIKIMSDLLENGNRIALTCFEADHNYCHRNEASKYLYSFINQKYELKHL
ncbi:MAG: DUF488 family protein [Candidatus Gracilibacteria bacterium]|nr:DUF488 family protein [Candidatus Gracilibacteria bacterium]